MQTPVALILFNRPDCTARVFEAIAAARPAKLFLIADGPRAHRPDDAARCAAARAVVERVAWPCEVVRVFSDENLGCKLRPVTGIDRLFAEVEEAIILEDDCLPHPSFFPFCEELLARYRDDKRVMMIGGVNFLGELRPQQQSYYFSRFGSTWGWASWRRAWQLNDPDLRLWPRVQAERILEQMFPDPVHCRYWQEPLERIARGELRDAWDYQWLLACWLNSGFRIVPAVNLISNIGFRADATHTFGASPFAAMPSQPLTFPLNHPPFVMRSIADDERIQEHLCVSDGWRAAPAPSRVSLVSRLARKLAQARSSF